MSKRKQYISLNPMLTFVCPYCGEKNWINYWDVKASDENTKDGHHHTDCAVCDKKVELVPIL